MLKPTFLAFVALICHHIHAEIEWRTIIKPGDSCTYLIPKEDLGYSWITPDFDLSSWIAAKSGIGFGDNDDSTIIDTSKCPGGVTSVYIRYDFNVTNKDDILALILDADFDDGFVVYLNSNEIARGNIPGTVSWNMTLDKENEAKMPSGKNPELFLIRDRYTKSFLKTGRNILAIEVHNAFPSSDDMSSNFFLYALVKKNTENFSQVPSWFKPNMLFSQFNLPLMVINTDWQSISKDRKIEAKMGLIDKNGHNYTFLTPNDYSGNISIKLRGESTIDFEKKSFSIELHNNDSSSRNASLLGLPEENDFVLYAPFNDKTMMRNVLVYEIYREMGYWAPRTRFIELILNDSYEGVYVLTEKVKRDKNRINIKKLEPEDSSIPKVTGGYILRTDKLTGLQNDEYWKSEVTQPFHDTITYQFYDPDFDKLSKFQKAYIKNWLKSFDEFLSGTEFPETSGNYKKYIDSKSFVNMMMINELSKNLDGYRFSNYFYKNRNTVDSKLVSGAPWDYDITFGNVNYRYDDNFPYTFDWVYTKNDRVYWWQRLMMDTIFQNQVYCAYGNYRKKTISDEHLNEIIDSCVNFLGPAIERNFIRFPILGKYVWPNEKYPPTYADEITNLKTWIKDRTAWLDGEWLGKCKPEVQSSLIENETEAAISVFPNPSDFSNLFVHIKTDKKSWQKFEISTLEGKLVYSKKLHFLNNGENPISVGNLSRLPKGIYCYKFFNNSGSMLVGKLFKNK